MPNAFFKTQIHALGQRSRGHIRVTLTRGDFFLRPIALAASFVRALSMAILNWVSCDPTGGPVPSDK